MIARSPRTRARAGITLTEILISIMIMGVGLLSLATLFPLGILRIQESQRFARSALLTESAQADTWGRGMLFKPSFFATWYGAYARSQPYDPFIFDPLNPNAAAANVFSDGGVFRYMGGGLPVCYDPLWWQEVGFNSGGAINPVSVAGNPDQGRFAFGQGYIRPDPGGGAPSAYGLQRLTNFPLTNPYFSAVTLSPEKVFASDDDLVMQSDGVPNVSDGLGSPLVPDLSTGATLADLEYTWLITGRQTDVTNGRVFDGDVVICHNRSFAYEQVQTPLGGPILKAADEVVVEAVWGYGPPAGGAGYAPNDKTVLLRWPSNMEAPKVRVGGWIADVTYERTVANSGRFSGVYPGQRCYWYRVAKRSDVADDPGLAGYSRMTVTLATPVRARTLLTTGASGPEPVHVEAALVMPSVVNVFSKVFIVR